MKAPPQTDDLTGTDLAAARRLHLDTDCPSPLEQDLGHERAALDLEVGPGHHRVQVCTGRAQSPPSSNRAVESVETLLLVPVHVVGELVAGLLYRFEEGREQRTRGGPAFEQERAVGPPVLVTTGEAGLHAFEVGETMRIVPIRHIRIGRPPLIIKWVAALEDHPVDAARPAEDLPARVIYPPPAHVRFRLGLVLPVVEAVPYGHGQAPRAC